MNSDNPRTSRLCAFVANKSTAVAQMNIHTGKKTNKTKIRNLKFLFLYFPFLYFLLILNSQFSIIFPTSSPHRGTRSAQRACRQAKDKLFEPPQGGELFVF
jgi:hypothetical protein